MNIAGQYSLACATFALDEQGDTGGGKFLNFLPKLLHEERAAKNHVFGGQIISPKCRRKLLGTGYDQVHQLPRMRHFSKLPGGNEAHETPNFGNGHQRSAGLYIVRIG